VEIAGDRVALSRGNPEVRAAGVENNLEGLGRSSERDLREVWSLSATATRSTRHAELARLTLGVQEVADGHGVGAVDDVGCLERGRHVRLGVHAGHALLGVLLLEASHLGLDVGILLVAVR
jgi:hypothetical protein